MGRGDPDTDQYVWMNDADPDHGIVAMGTVKKPCSRKSWVPFVAKKACPAPPDRKQKTGRVERACQL